VRLDKVNLLKVWSKKMEVKNRKKRTKNLREKIVLREGLS
jgi:hypothetical protein